MAFYGDSDAQETQEWQDALIQFYNTWELSERHSCWKTLPTSNC